MNTWRKSGVAGLAFWCATGIVLYHIGYLGICAGVFAFALLMHVGLIAAEHLAGGSE